MYSKQVALFFLFHSLFVNAVDLPKKPMLLRPNQALNAGLPTKPVKAVQKAAVKKNVAKDEDAQTTKPQSSLNKIVQGSSDLAKKIGFYGAWKAMLPKRIRTKKCIGSVTVVDIASYLTASVVLYTGYWVATKGFKGASALASLFTLNNTRTDKDTNAATQPIENNDQSNQNGSGNRLTYGDMK